jgi:ppGpp synthetase/RelA/SpoT-type nucleotidyltranferase
MTDLGQIRKRWIAERPTYRAFVEFLERDIHEKLRASGIYADVKGREKELDSLLKKLLVKKDETYEGLSDKAGVRVIVRFRSEIPEVEKVIAGNCEVIKREDKTAALEVDRFGYQGLHLDIKLARGSEAAGAFASLKAEVQIRTKSQHLWSELDHELAYKTNIEIPGHIRRRLFILLALLEMADREFESVNTDISELPNAAALRLLFALEKQFFKVNPIPYSKELSIQVINTLSPLYKMTEGLFQTHFEDFYREKAKELESVFREAQGRSLFLSQPEVLMVFDLLDRVPYKLAEEWGKSFPLSELEELARIWGKPLS